MELLCRPFSDGGSELPQHISGDGLVEREEKSLRELSENLIEFDIGN